MAAEKIIRFSAEDAGLGDRIQRYASQMQEAFGKLNMASVLDEADKKFTKLGDKAKYIKDKITEITDEKSAKTEERVGKVESGGGNQYYKDSTIRSLRAVQDDYHKNADNLLNSFNKFVESAGKKVKEEEGSMAAGGAGGGGSDSGGGMHSGSYLNFVKDFFSGNFGGMAQHGMNAGAEGLSSLATKLPASMDGITAALSGVAAGLAAVAAVAAAVVTVGYRDAKSEIAQRKFLMPGEDIAHQFTPQDLAHLDLSYGDVREQAIGVERGRRSTAGLRSEVHSRALLKNTTPLADDDIGGLDRFFKYNQFSKQYTDEGGTGRSATMQIFDLLDRSEKMGLLGVSKGDFSALPEKIQTLQAVLSTQFATSNQINASAVTGMILAGEQIGGMFAGPRAGQAFSSLNESIRSPSSQGTKALFMSLLSKQHPDKNPLELQAMLEGGLTPENMNAIMPAFENIPNGYYKQLLMKSVFTGRAANPNQQAMDLARGDNLGLLREGANQMPSQSGIGDEEAAADKRNDKLIMAIDGIKTGFENLGTNISRHITNAIHLTRDFNPKESQGSSESTDRQMNKVHSADPIGTMMPPH